MLPRELDDLVCVICKDDVSLGVKFQYQVISEGIRPESEHDHSLNSNLLDGFESPAPKELPKLN
jgi:hypothetical protein